MAERQFCEKHREWYVPSTGPYDPNGVPCPGCRLEGEAHWRQCEDQNIRAMLDLPCGTCAGTGWLCASTGRPATGECCGHPSGCPSSNGCPDCHVPGECGGRGYVGEAT